MAHENVWVELYGVCCSCQGLHPVRRSDTVSEADMDEDFGSLGYDCEELYVMAPHLAFGDHGPECSGVGTVPQVIPD